MEWDPELYARFDDHRSRPFFDLTARIPVTSPRRIVDLGCGSGELTATLARRWPSAEVLGIDSSAAMIAKAQTLTDALPNLRFAQGDIAAWVPDPHVDVVVSNAAFQWVPGHPAMIRAWLTNLNPHAWLAFQVPGNFSAPSHRLMRQLAESDRWRDRLAGVLRHADAVSGPVEYADLCLDAGWLPDVWETTYLQLLPGDDAVLNWTRGTGLRPILAALNEDETLAFEADYRTALRQAYPPTESGTWFPFRRLFCVGHRPDAGPAT